MRAFLKQFLFFSLLLPIPIYVKPLYLIVTEKYKYHQNNDQALYNIYINIKKSKQNQKAKKLLLGDSVAQQLFANNEYRDPLNSLTCNQAIGIPGQYFLLTNYLLSGNRPDTLYLLFTPMWSSFQNNLDQVYTFHYFLKPFYTNEYTPLFTESLFTQIHKIPFYFLSREPYILTSNWSPDFTSEDKYYYTFLSPISKEYLKKIKDLSIKYHFTIILIPAPVNSIQKTSIENINHTEIATTGMDKEFSEYFNNISYLDDSLFSDKIHLKNPAPYTKLYKEKYFPELLNTSTTK